ncbi:MAG TPA: hypothetical protein VF987_07835 [Rhodospirillales bacterium]|jgi:hypothetical protein
MTDPDGPKPAALTRALPIALAICWLAWSGAAFGQQSAAMPKDLLDMKVTVKCQGGDAVFMIVNHGKAWPEPGVISVYWTGVTRLVHERRMRLGAGQRITFRVPGVAGDNFEFGLWVNPSWFKRQFDYDARIKCG